MSIPVCPCPDRSAFFLTVQMIPKSADALCGDLIDNLFFQYKDGYTFYQDAMARLPVSSTPDRAQKGTRLLCNDAPVCWDHPSVTSTPRSFGALSSSLSTANMQMFFSPSPLAVSQVPSLVYPEISPPSQGSGSTPFERQFSGDFSREWCNINAQISPIVRGNPDDPSSLSSTCPNHRGTQSRCATSQDPKDSVERVSLIDRFISAAADENLTTEPSLDRSSPLSDLSDLSSLSSPRFSDRFGPGLDLRNDSPPTSPTAERHNGSGKSSVQDDGQPPSSVRASSRRSTRSSSLSCDPDYQPAKGTTKLKRKRTSNSRDGDEMQMSRKKTQQASAAKTPPTDAKSSLGETSRRQLPTNIPYHPQFPLFYLRFPVSSYLQMADGTFPLLPVGSKRMAGIYNEPRDALDLYTPRFVKGCGASKVGVCPICIESPSRGGKGEVVWLSMKFSAYKWMLNMQCSYHLQYAHGISSTSARPFSPPVAFRTTECQNPSKNERKSIQEGKCHRCKKWVLVESVKNMDIKVKELYWWKHAAACHQGTHIEGDDDFFSDDDIYRRAQQTISS